MDTVYILIMFKNSFVNRISVKKRDFRRERHVYIVRLILI